ncbi:hypothetical protein PR048_019925 [Dryococelus australis]|uniref:Uncharacterized protein n=1 Tax=Dryococelus australis TaxID=614101 RepID=A0ABQ9H4U9_9NEOP|nr:hypothetical protein PR048_019925 [Dryococelus australis]
MNAKTFLLIKKNVFSSNCTKSLKMNKKTFFMGKIHVQNIARCRRHGLYDKPSTSRRQVTISHVVPDGKEPLLSQKPTCEFLNEDLNMNLLFRAFKEKHPHSQISFKLAHRVVNSCNKCDKLKARIICSTTENENTEARTNMVQHHMNAEEAQEWMRTYFNALQMPGSKLGSLCMGLQKVMFVPSLTYSSMYYSRQLST